MKWKEKLDNKWFLLSIATILGVLLRTIVARIIFLQPDEEIFAYIANGFMIDRSLDFLITEAFHWLGFSFFLSFWLKIFGTSIFTARMFSVLSSAVLIISTFLILMRITRSKKIAFFGSLLLSIMPFALRYGHMVLTEPLVWAFLSVSIFILVYAFEKDRWYLFIISGFLAIMGAFVRRSALMMFFIIVPTMIWLNRDSIKKMMKRTSLWVLGYLGPLVIGVGGLFFYYGLDKLKEMNFTKVPHLGDDLTASATGFLTQESFLYAAQPISWKALGFVILTMVACGVLLMALFKNKWKVVYLGAIFWPALAAVSFHLEVSDLTMARLIVLPIIVLFIEKKMKKSFQFYLALSILLGSAVAFSTINIQGNLWNVVVYISIGAVILMFLEDQMSSKIFKPFFFLGGISFLILIMLREPRLETLFSVLLPVAGMTYCLGVPISNNNNQGIIYGLWGLFIPILFFNISDPFAVLTAAFFLAIGILVLMTIQLKRGWRLVSFLFPVGAIFFLLFIPGSVPFWGIYLPILGTIIFMISGQLRSNLFKKVDHILPITGSIMAFIMVYIDTNSLFLSSVALVMVGSFSTVMRQLHTLSDIWKKLISEKISVLFFMLVIGYLAFYDYYLWREVYFTELLFQATVLGGLLIWVFRSKINIWRMEKTDNKIKRILKPVRIRRRVSVLFMIFIVLSIPVSIQAYIQTDWFQEEPMDQRPYMRTMVSIGNWIEDHTEEDDKILAWHCYAVEANRETILEISNAKVYNAKQTIETMEEENVNIFVRCFYTTHGLWNQKVFQDYILNNFYIDKMIDGNECWLRSAY